MTPDEFYNQLAPFYHLICPDWEASMTQQAAALDSILQEFWGAETTTILDVACGIGTQTLGLAQLGYQVTASDLARAAVARARHEAAARHLDLHCLVADMRHTAVSSHQLYDVVMACDNAVPHLLTDEDMLTAFRAWYTCVRLVAAASLPYVTTTAKTEQVSRSSRMAYVLRVTRAICCFRSGNFAVRSMNWHCIVLRTGMAGMLSPMCYGP